MKSIIFLLATSQVCGQNNTQKKPRGDFQNDYCSYVHSQYVLDRIKSEVMPIFETYGLSMIKDGQSCSLNNFDMIDSHLKKFGDKRYFKQNQECPICKKSFEGDDYLEFHMKIKHFRDEKLQTKYSQQAMICPADLCDIFECPEFSEKALRLQVYTDRSDQNYEGSIDLRDGGKKRRIKGEQTQNKDLPPLRYELMQHYDANMKANLLQRCHRLFLDCVDYDSVTNNGIVLKAFDFFSQIYCQKFEPRGMEDLQMEEHDQYQQLGIYKMIADIHDEYYESPLFNSNLKDYKQKKHHTKKTKELVSGLTHVFAVVTLMLLFLYGVGIYMTYFDDPKGFRKRFGNEHKKTPEERNMMSIIQENEIDQKYRSATLTPAQAKLKEKHVD